MRRLLPFALAALLALTLVPGIAAIAALDWREARDATVAAESTERREWVIPTLAHEAWFEKPVVGYAHEMLAARALRTLVPGALADVAASRLARVLLAAALALLVAMIGQRCFGARAGWLAACALASMVALPLTTRADGSQLLATLCAWLAIGGFLSLAKGARDSGDATRLTAWLGLGAAALIGGPLSALWPLAGFALYFGLARTPRGWRPLRPLAGGVLVLGMVLPWYGTMTILHGAAFVRHMLWFPYAAEARGAWYTGPLLAFSFTLVLAFPWTPVLGAALRDATARLQRKAPDSPHDLRDDGHVASLLLALMFAGAAPIVLYPGPPLTSAMPAMPAIALLCGRFLDRVLDGDVEHALLTHATRLTAAVGTAAALLLVMFAPRLPEASVALRQLAVVLLLASWAPLLADLLMRRKLAAALFALPVALGAPLLQTQVLPRIEPWLDARPVADAMLSASPPDAALLVLDPPPPSLRLALARNLVLVRPPLATLPRFVARDGYAYVAFTPEREHDALRDAQAPLEILRRTPALILARVRYGVTRTTSAAPDTTAAR